MTAVHAAWLIALALALPSPETVLPMTEDRPALKLDVHPYDGGIEVRLIGASARTQQVSYVLEVTGKSTSRHRGKTTLTAGTTAVLSTMRASAGENWCVKLMAEEAERDPYEIIRGSCETKAG